MNQGTTTTTTATRTDTNIKGLPSGPRFFTECLYSDRHPWAEVKKTAKTVTIAKVLVTADPAWKAQMNFIPGGFCGHMANQAEQTWLFDRIDETQTMIIRKNKRDQWVCQGRIFTEGTAIEFYDYNF